MCALLTGVVIVGAAYLGDRALPTRPSVQITDSLPQGRGLSGQPIVIFAEASDPDGIAQVDMWVNGQSVGLQKNPDPSSRRAFESSQAWIAGGPGNYLIVIKATDREGFVGESVPLAIVVEDRNHAAPADELGEYRVAEGDTLESIAALFGATPDELLAHNPGLGELLPGTILLVPPPPEGEAAGDAAPPPGDAAGAEVPIVDAPAPPPAPGGETEAEPASDPLWTLLPLPDGFACLFYPESCGRAIDIEPPPFPAPRWVGSEPGEGCAIDVSWTDGSENEDGFRIYRFTSRPRFRMDLLEIVGPGEGSETRLNYRDRSPPRGEFFYAVAAYNAGGDTWSGPSSSVESAGCPPDGPILGQPVVVEGLSLSLTGSFDRLYCYASLADSPFERIPAGTGNFITLEAGSWNIAEHFSGRNKREVMASAVDSLNIVVECLGWQGEELINLGRFSRAHPPAEWDGRPLTAGPDGGGFSLTYRINPSFHAADESGRAAWPLIDPGLNAPFNLRAFEDTSDCRLPPDRRPPGDPCQRSMLGWEYTPVPGDARLPTAYKIYRRAPGGSVPILYHTSPGSRRSAPLATDDCNATVFYSVSAVVGNDPITGEEIQSPLSEEFASLPTCASLEITLEFLWVSGVYDGDPCGPLFDCRNDYEAYGWLSFNGHILRWNDHCDTSFFDFDGCTYVAPSYSTLDEATGHNWADFMLNQGDGWGRGNNVIRIPIADGEALSFAFTLMDHDVHSPDTSWCGPTGREMLHIPSRSAADWQTMNESFEYDGVDSAGDHCIIRFHVEGLP